jgi:hypothetical protein
MKKLEYIPGDLVMVDGFNTVYKIDSVESQPHVDDFLYELVPIGIGPILFDLPADSICPILITPKILSINGFKKVREDESGVLYFKKGLGVDIVYSYVCNCYDIYINGNKILKGIESVHELQNFLFGLKLNYEMNV